MERLKKWFFLNRRQLPWRENPSPYEVWVSEVMLQQTQVNVVIPYFKRWMERFPTIAALAQAPIEEVIKIWEGLGYYSRARNLHAGAQYLLEYHGGELPQTPEELKKVKGLGPYTIGAILGFAFKQKAAAVDGNVLRVLARYYALEGEIDKSNVRREIEERVLELLPNQEPWIVMEALIELGALVCQKVAKCSKCPLQATCRAKREGKVDVLPRKGKKASITVLHRLVAVILGEGEVLLRKGEKGKVMADLWEFPYLEMEREEKDLEKLHQLMKNAFSLVLNYQKTLPIISHGFTRYKAHLYPHIWAAHEKRDIPGYEWVALDALASKPFSSGHKRVLSSLEK